MAKLSVSVYDYNQQTEFDVSSRAQSASITESIDSASESTVTLKSIYNYHAHDDILVRYADNTLFDGIILNQSDILRGGSTQYRFTTWKSKDASLRMEKRVVNKVYTNELVEDIIADLLNSYPCGVTGNNVGITNTVIEQIAFTYINLYECIKQLAEMIGWRWYVDTNRDLHFFDVDEGEGETVFSTTTDGGLTRNILRDTITVDSEINDLTANRVWIIGAREAAANYVEQTYTGDGSNDLFQIAFIPNYPSITENGQAKTIEVERGGESTRDYTYDKENRVLRRVAGPLPSGVSTVFRYRPTRQVIDYFENTASIATYGIYEKAIKDKTIKEKLAARKRGRSELKRRSSIIRRISFDTRELNVRRGLQYRIVIPELEIDSMYLCTSVTTHISAPDNVNITKSVEFEEVV